MIEGELYVLEAYPKCVFAYKAESARTIYHYACVNYHDEVKIPGIGCATGTLTGQPTRIANDEERRRFYGYIYECGFYYNMKNRKVIKIRTGELV